MVMKLILILALGAAAFLQEEMERTDEGVGLTIYSTATAGQPLQGYYDEYGQWKLPTPGYAVVKEWRKIKLDKGKNTIRFTDVAGTIDAATVNFKSLTDPDGTTVIEQNYEYDLVSADKILQKYIGKKIQVQKGAEAVNGTLLSFDSIQLVLQVDDPNQPLQIIRREQDKIKFGALPGGLITKPTLVWMLDSAKGGDQLAKVTYQADNIGWKSDYTAVISKNDKKVDLSGWVTITNNTGSRYRDAELKLVAGDVHRVTRQAPQQRWRGEDEKAKREGGAGGFVEKSFFEYHLYTLQRKTTIENSSIKQIELFDPVDAVPAKKIFVYNGNAGQYYYGYMVEDQNFGMTSNKKVDIYLQFENKKESGLGIPLPAGKVRVYKKDEADGSLEFIGEDKIDHTPKDERVRLMLGNAFDIVGEKKQTAFKINRTQKWMKESFEIKIKNHKEEAVEVLIAEGMFRWTNWQITESSDEYRKLDAFNVHFPVKVDANSEKIVTYTVQYSW